MAMAAWKVVLMGRARTGGQEGPTELGAPMVALLEESMVVVTAADRMGEGVASQGHREAHQAGSLAAAVRGVGEMVRSSHDVRPFFAFKDTQNGAQGCRKLAFDPMFRIQWE